MPVHAAVALERSKDPHEAAAAWQALRDHPGLVHHDYEAALVTFNYGLAAARLDADSVEARRALIDSQRRLEQVADDFESAGQRDRAFDCYQILLRLGKESHQFENLAEGYLNCIRVLRDDHLTFYVLQYYEDFIRLALERDEFHAASTLYQEAATYAARANLPYDRFYRQRAAQTWVRCASKFQEQGAPVQMIANALLAATSQFSAIGDYPAVRDTFSRLSALDFPEHTKKRFKAIAGRYNGMPGVSVDIPGLPEYLKHNNAYADIWFADLLEWEMDGDPMAVSASIVGDLKYPNRIRRRALVALLTICDAQLRQVHNDPQTSATVAGLLGELATAPASRPCSGSAPSCRRSAC
ncbi:MAG: hypothetical protein HC863_02860 [Myxococcales bacterium]|nr:hypothetical protein [Myxococcales bacterium]